VEMPSVQNIRHNGTGGMPSSCFMAVAPMKCCVTIWEEFIVKTDFEVNQTKMSKPKCQMNVKIIQCQSVASFR
jgi:hypothetical protein